MKKVRTRYAPSPTGYLHIGGARTALFCYLFAKHFKGDFIFRLEDTDIKRNVVDGEKSQLENLAWLGIIPDESPFKKAHDIFNYRQSEKLERYSEIANHLIKLGHAYKAYDNTDELEEQKKQSDAAGIPSFRYNRNWLKLSQEEILKRDAAKEYSIRLKMPNDKIYEWDDIVRGKISFNSADLGDWVIYKSDGYPTYNFAVVVDDFDMRISHVLRGEEHIGNTPKQLALYDMLNWQAPKFGHLTIITNMEGQKLSKRDTSLKQFIEDYKNEGYSPEAVFNFLALLGWTSADATELMNKEELIYKFDPTRLSKSPSKFDITKMQWFSKQYIKNTDNEQLLTLLNLKDSLNFSKEWLLLFIDTFKQSAYTLSQIKEHLNDYIKPNNTMPQLNSDELLTLKTFRNNLDFNNFSVESIQEAINKTQNILQVKGKKLFMPIRLGTTYVEHGPELAKAIYLFGKDLIKQRLELWK
ncbi:glutamate--tRNA ligase [Mycoplasmopsis alligatoris]|uniref:Glutamate--tRNA ligase n=1 Tax=Mycoplasmopsis alligatoris A21JP2 TaxID=747682 RepID=D4XV68_9BACT|nr:glutamate--tRNA ligase [Mycoplasmopsis alligatoris]EFF41772.1 glutamate--tRNA ligase [Mycoplasmopsis alligatoris A21JP2]